MENVNKENDRPVVKWFNAEKVTVSKVLIELTGKNKEFVKRVRFETDIGDITYKPKNEIVESGEISGFATLYKKNELMTVSDFVLNNSMAKLLSEESKKKPQQIIISYAVIENTDSDEVVEYRYLNKSQWEIIYWKDHHGSDTVNLDKQLEMKAKFAGEEL